MGDRRLAAQSKSSALVSGYDDIWLIDGVRTPFADYNGAFGLVSPTDLGIKVAREIFKRTGLPAADVGSVICGNMAQASFDVFCLPRHVCLYSGVPMQVPAVMVQRVCGTGVETLMQAADAITLGRIQLGLCVGTESMSRNPIAAYTHRGGFVLGRVEFKDFLWEALTDTAADLSMGDTAERLAREYKLTRQEVDQFAHESFTRALAAQASGFLAGEITPVRTETFELAGYKPRGIRMPRKIEELAVDNHVRPSPVEALAKLPPAFGGVQTGGNSSAIVDGAVAALVGSGDYVRSKKVTPLGRMVAGAVVGVAPDNMGIGPVAAIRPLLANSGLKVRTLPASKSTAGFRRPVHGGATRTRHRARTPERQWRRHRHRPPAGGHWPAPCDHCGARTAARQ